MAETKQQKQKNEKASRQKRVSLAKEKVLSLKRNILKVVEGMLEENIPKEWFFENCVKLCQLDYDDVVQERSIERLCGYPLCSKVISTDIKQQYKISRTSNKVYDLTERKCFCCNQCFKASNYLKSQLSEVPLYMRKPGLSIPINLLPETDNRGSSGEEIVFHHTLLTDPDIEQGDEPSVSNLLSDFLLKEVKVCEEQLSNLKIKENVYESPYVFGAKDTRTKDSSDGIENTSNCSEEDDSEDDDVVVNGDDDDGQANFPEYSNLSIYSNKHMPIPDRVKKVVLISPITPTKIPQSAPSSKLSVEFIGSVFHDWFTEDTMKYLLGERRMYSMKADILFQTMISSDAPNSEKLSSTKNEYIDLCLRIDQMQEEEDELSDSAEIEIGSTSGDVKESDTFKNSLCNSNKVPLDSISEDGPAPTHSIPKRRPKGKNKTVSFAPGVKDAKYISKEKVVVPSEVPEEEEYVSEPIFPLIDSMSQNALRRRVLTTKLKAVYFDVLPEVGLQFKDIREGVVKIVETFSLTPRNIIFKPKEWKCIALVLFRILTKTTLKDLEGFEDDKYSKLCEASKMNLIIGTQEIEDLVSDLISSNQLRRFQGSHDSK